MHFAGSIVPEQMRDTLLYDRNNTMTTPSLLNTAAHALAWEEKLLRKGGDAPRPSGRLRAKKASLASR